jgi:hypothetical protein
MNTETWTYRLRVGGKAGDLALFKNIVAKSKDLKTRWFHSKTNLAESSEEGYGPNKAVSSIMTTTMMMMMMTTTTTTLSSLRES